MKCLGAFIFVWSVCFYVLNKEMPEDGWMVMHDTELALIPAIGAAIFFA